MNIDKPQCNLKTCRYCHDHNCFGDYERCEYTLAKRPHGEWKALGFQQGYAFFTCSNCDKTMRLYRDSKNEFCCIKDIREKVIACMYCGARMRGDGE